MHRDYCIVVNEKKKHKISSNAMQWYARSSIKVRQNGSCFSRGCGTQMRKDENVEQLLRFKEDRYKC